MRGSNSGVGNIAGSNRTIQEKLTVRITLTLDDHLLLQAQTYLPGLDITTLVHEALRVLVERESARQLARLGGTEPHLKNPTRRRRLAG